MSVQLEIRDGSPWWLSPDIWTVPGDDPESSPGTPIVGVAAYLWANVRNNGSTAVTDAVVRFYWANPNTGFDRNTANLIGNSFVSLNPGQAQDVLCLNPWIPSFVNGGHECVLAEAFHPSDPLPAAPDFNVPTDRHVAQRNLNVVMASMSMFSASFEIHNPSRNAKEFRIRIEEGKLEELKPLAARYGDLVKKLNAGKIKSWNLSDQRCASGDPKKQERPVDHPPIKIGPGGRAGLTLAGEITGDSVIFHVRQFDGDREVGGLSILVINR